MKKILFAAAALFISLAATAQVNEEQERLNQEPPVVTDRQVQRDAKKAAEVRSDNDKLPDNSEELKKQQAKDMKANKRDAKRQPRKTAVKTTTPAEQKTKKSSTKPEKQ